MNIPKRKREILNNVPSSRKHQRRVQLEMKILTYYAGIGFRILFIKYLYLFIYLYALFKSYHTEIISSTINVNKSNNTTGTK